LDVLNRVALITGASSGIGAATARALAQAGCRVAMVARSGDALAELAVEIRNQGGQALALPADVTDRSSAGRAVEQTLEAFAGLDILVNNAGVGLHETALTAPWANLERVLDVNLYGPLAFIRAAVPHMRVVGGGLIINVSSIIGRRALPGAGIYCASKAALERLTDSLRLELAADNIRVVTLYPGVTRTDFNQHTLDTGRGLRPGRMKGVSPQRVAGAMLRIIKHEPRDAYVTLLDRAFVTFAVLLPGVTDAVLRGYLSRRH
jgi:NADP-dependent 3-hydroxy acid dehydrogenase YdfG